MIIFFGSVELFTPLTFHHGCISLEMAWSDLSNTYNLWRSLLWGECRCLSTVVWTLLSLPLCFRNLLISLLKLSYYLELPWNRCLLLRSWNYLFWIPQNACSLLIGCAKKVCPEEKMGKTFWGAWRLLDDPVWYWRVQYLPFLPPCNRGIFSSLYRNCLSKSCVESFEINVFWLQTLYFFFNFILMQDLKGGGRSCKDEISR